MGADHELRVEDVEYSQWKDETQMPLVMGLIEKDLSEPYSIFTYRYFINNWPSLCIPAMIGERCVGVIVNKLERHRSGTMRGYIAMLAEDKNMRKRKIGSTLVKKAIEEMDRQEADEVVLEAEDTNTAA